MPTDTLGVLLAQGPQLLTQTAVDPSGVDALGDLGVPGSWLAVGTVPVPAPVPGAGASSVVTLAVAPPSIRGAARVASVTVPTLGCPPTTAAVVVAPVGGTPICASPGRPRRRAPGPLLSATLLAATVAALVASSLTVVDHRGPSSRDWRYVQETSGRKGPRT